MSANAAAQQLPGFLHTLEPALNRFGYIGITGLVFAEDFGVPVPGETVLILGAIYAGAGRMSIVLVALMGFCAALLGDNVAFAIGHFGGRQFVERYGRYLFLTRKRLDRAERLFERQGGKIVVVARFIEGLRQANGLIAGTVGMAWKRFLLFNAIGAALWIAVWSTIGYLSGSHIDAVYDDATHAFTYLASAVGVSLLAYVTYRLKRRRRGAAVPRAAEGIVEPRRETASGR